MTKQLLFLCMLLTIALRLFASGGGEDDQLVQLRLGTWPEESQTAQVAAALATKEKFEGRYSNIEVIPANYRYSPDTFLPLAASGQLPTVYTTWFTEPQKIIDNGFARDISTIVERYGYDKDMNPAIRELLSREDRIYGIPRDGYALGLYINMNIFREAGLVDENGLPLYPKTFDELARTAQLITERTGRAGLYIASKDNVGGWHFTNLAWNFGANFSRKDNNRIIANINSPEVLEAFEFIHSLRWEYDVLLDNTLLGWAEWIQNYGTNQVAMVFAASDVVNLPVNDYGLSKDAIAIAPIPAGPRGDQYSLLGGTPFMFAPDATDREVDAALKWLDFDGRLGSLTEESLENRRLDLQIQAEAGFPIGPQALRVWMNDEANRQIDLLYEEFENVNMELFKDYYDISQYNLRSEEQYFAQDLYSLLDDIIQVVLNEENADIGSLLDTANQIYQANFLNQLN